MGQFSGGEALKAKLESYLKNATNAKIVEVGFLEGTTYPDGISVPMVAATQEFGSPAHNIPSRPFFRNMIAKEKGHWGEDITKILKHNHYDAKLSLTQMGEEIEGELVQSIQDTNEPKLAPATIARKGFDKPLIDTSIMWKSIDSQVK